MKNNTILNQRTMNKPFYRWTIGTLFCMLGEVVNFRSAVESVSYGVAPWLDDYYGVWLTLGNFSVIFLILYAMYHCRYFIKI